MSTTRSTALPDGGLKNPGPGLLTLDPVHTALLHGLDDLLTGLAARLSAPEVVGPPLLSVEGLARLDYFRNFPHLGVSAGRFTPEALDGLAAGENPAELPLRPTGHLLPSATCYGLLLSLEGRDVGEDGLRLSATGRCFRNETHYDGLRRLWGFHMREVLYLGTKQGAVEHLENGAEFIQELAGLLGLELTRATADDPFYDRGGSRARLMALDPVKHEFSAPDGTAIASVNRHRNFFGERLDIRAGAEGPAYSACVAFGVERWVHAMILAHGTPEQALARLRAASAA
ncbi:aminoacyl--tRNA ligase-related protein [Streptomyces stackebrandtii]|uniref:aminoacyl--tRNA ligase-related protein n=1 Tax=Streptomyces stackebrandtii TaxID=3051177 RepID=UPI0028DB1D08|nr:aminoacyl--tRNA ligase-related protein [Streptomyces sp. DSM 40976]